MTETLPELPTLRAQQECARWLGECLRMGWTRDKLDALESLWWEHHDTRGNPTSAIRATPKGE